jgi:hypothetical protein
MKCSNCFQEKPETEFYLRLRRDPSAGRQHRCKTCNAEVVRGYNHRRKARLIKERWARIRSA